MSSTSAFILGVIVGLALASLFQTSTKPAKLPIPIRLNLNHRL